MTEQRMTNSKNPESVPRQFSVAGVGETVEERYEDPCEPVHDVGRYVGLAVLGVRVHLDHHGGREGAEEVGEEDADDDPGHPLLPPEPLLLPADVLKVVPVQAGLSLNDAHAQAVTSAGKKVERCH